MKDLLPEEAVKRQHCSQMMVNDDFQISITEKSNDVILKDNLNTEPSLPSKGKQPATQETAESFTNDQIEITKRKDGVTIQQKSTIASLNPDALYKPSLRALSPQLLSPQMPESGFCDFTYISQMMANGGMSSGFMQSAESMRVKDLIDREKTLQMENEHLRFIIKNLKE